MTKEVTLLLVTCLFSVLWDLVKVCLSGLLSVHSLFIAVSTGPIVFKEHVLNKKQLPVPRQCVGFSLSLHVSVGFNCLPHKPSG